MLSKLRKRAGAWRSALVDGPTNRRLAEQAQRQRAAWIDAAAWDLPPLQPAPAAPADVAVEVHSLCGEAQVSMGLWASWSLLRFLPDARFVLHSDGSLTPDTITRWRTILPGMRVLDRPESLATMERELADFPRVLAWSRAYHFGFKLGGVQCSVAAPKLIELDTDVIVLRRPDALRAAVDDPTCTLSWNVGQQYSYGYPEALLHEVLGPLLKRLPERLNGGLVVGTPLDRGDWAHLEACLERLDADPRIDPLRYWMQQTLAAFVADRRGAGARPLPRGYTIYSGPMRADTVTRHFVGNPGVRPRFFTEGVPALIADAKARGQLPADFGP